MANVRELTWKLGWQISDAPIKKADADTDKLDKRVSKLGKNTENLDRQARKGFGGFGSWVKQGLGIFAGFQIGNTVVNTLKSGIGLGIQFDSTMQQNEIAFTSMLGSAEKARSVLGELATMAAKTPFELPQLTDATKKLLAYGFQIEKIPNMLTSIGDATSGLGLGADGINRITIALGQMQAKGRIQAQEILQLTEAGIPATQILADKFGITTQEVMKLQEQGLIPAKEGIEALIQGMEEKFPHMMDKQSKSFSGLMSTLKDNTQMVLGRVMKPMFDKATSDWLPAIIKKTDEFQQKYEQTGSVIEAFDSTFAKSSSNALNHMEAGIEEWLNNGGNEKLKNFGIKIGDLLNKGVIAMSPAITKTAIALGTSFGNAAVNGIETAIQGHPLVATLLGAYVGGRVAGPIGAIAGGFVGAVGSIPKAGIAQIPQGSQVDMRNNKKLNNTPGFKRGQKLPTPPKFASGVQNFGGGWAITSEEGPELLHLPHGTDVIPNRQTEKILNNNSRSSAVFAPQVSVSVQGGDNPQATANAVEAVLKDKFYPMIEEFFYMLSTKNPVVVER